MQLKLTWKVSGQNRTFDLLVSDEQKIAETLAVLKEKELVQAETADAVRYVRSLRTNHQIPVLLDRKSVV